ncbi:MAG: hypothetical protein IPN39_07355 [Chitinophagaceae bacterium]|nr:hypothetical protein [Chitinophagaceae bacterium]MBL0306413.1 hypothetical protein [Chitinophagaceae bacterium]HQV60737.1 hypothetical protein [Chitinophagaceae bacterium]HQZ75572.1 hypothetical protein [Chitinophagaceae bacterium]
MKIASIIFMLTFCLQADLFSQSIDSLRYKYTNQTIYRFGGVFQKGNERLGFKDLSREFSMSDLGFDLYVKAKKQRKTSTILRYASLASSIAFLGVAANNRNRNLAYGFLGGQMVFFMISMRYQGLSTQNLDQALWLRNKDVLFPDRRP